ncbi:hypothetical protein HHK36_013873 [Tetracentron sinense]|uniref:Uncharacterized protein n=1 Tax=Tetracentron sinense TaxID=13715 RepID=A0A834Z447_TETSI|nr:hypothetical protein HHK36_013873 [Tetracentron sinense]
MRPGLIVSLLLLLLLIGEAQGIRMEQGFISTGHQKIHVGIEFHQEESSLIKASGAGFGEVVLCRDGKCSGRSRKLMTETLSSSTTTTSKSVKSRGTQTDSTSKHQSSNQGLEGNEENFSVKSSPVSEHREVAPERYSDIIDITAMDYSPAKRKPPIHN